MAGEKTVAQELSSLVQARLNCIKANNNEWIERHEERIQKIVDAFLPSGAGWDFGTKLCLDSSRGDVLVLYGQFHHMDENGMYNGWTNHILRVTPSFDGFHISISGRNRNDIKEYLHEMFDCALRQVIAKHEGKAGLVYDSRAV